MDGIIPARAGNRRRSIEPISAIRDHPRACGEQSCRCPLPVRGAGSSPRVRGTDVPAQAVLRDGGIIPARAGNSFQFRVRTIDTRDHPRACGEQYFRQYGKTWYEGSSPRVRGTVSVLSLIAHMAGIIPARAGNSMTLVCEIRVGSGSSPRVRGTAHIEKIRIMNDGIIPARAGNRLKNPSSKHPIPLMRAPF